MTSYSDMGRQPGVPEDDDVDVQLEGALAPPADHREEGFDLGAGVHHTYENQDQER